MDDQIRIQDVATDAIRELLRDEQQNAALKDFVQEIGGLDKALAALAMPSQLEDAA